MTPRKSPRLRRALATAGSIGRRRLSSFLYALAVAGVPAVVVLASGGWDTVGFWVVALVWVAAVIYGAVLAVFIALLALSPVLMFAERVFPGRTDAVVARVSKASVIGLATVAFLGAAQLGDGEGVRLPTPWPNLGAFLIIGAAVAATFLLCSLAARSRVPKPIPGYARRHRVEEPDEEYWSDQCVVGWRAWNWDGSALRGVYARWASEAHEAFCRTCESAPSWDHDCGIYATKSPGDVHLFHGGPGIVGKVAMWGDIIEHEHGYRASHARITHLWVGDEWWAGRIRAAYPTVQVTVGTPWMSQEVA